MVWEVQTLVLGIFMGGMALGAWLVARYTARIRDLLLGYAVAEFGIGILALVFHDVFLAATGWAYDTALPALGGRTTIEALARTLADPLAVHPAGRMPSFDLSAEDASDLAAYLFFEEAFDAIVLAQKNALCGGGHGQTPAGCLASDRTQS